MPLKKHPAYWTCDSEGDDHSYYFTPANRAPGPYRKQRQVSAILDIADDGTLAGVELVFDMPPPPKKT